MADFVVEVNWGKILVVFEVMTSNVQKKHVLAYDKCLNSVALIIPWKSKIKETLKLVREHSKNNNIKIFAFSETDKILAYLRTGNTAQAYKHPQK